MFYEVFILFCLVRFTSVSLIYSHNDVTISKVHFWDVHDQCTLRVLSHCYFGSFCSPLRFFGPGAHVASVPQTIAALS